MLNDIVEACRQQTSEGGTITKKEAWDSIERLAVHAIRSFDSEGREKAFAVVQAACEFLSFFGREMRE